MRSWLVWGFLSVLACNFLSLDQSEPDLHPLGAPLALGLPSSETLPPIWVAPELVGTAAVVAAVYIPVWCYCLTVDPAGSGLVLVLGVCSPVRLVAVLAWQCFLAMLAGDAGVLVSHVQRELLGLPPFFCFFQLLGCFFFRLVYSSSSSEQPHQDWRNPLNQRHQSDDCQGLSSCSSSSCPCALTCPCIQLLLPAGSSSSP